MGEGHVVYDATAGIRSVNDGEFRELAGIRASFFNSVFRFSVGGNTRAAVAKAACD